MASHDVLVRGGGAVGLAAALALSRLGLEVALLEAAAGGAGAAPTGEDVRAYALNRASVDLLASLKAWDAIDPADRTPVHDMRVEGDAPGAVLEFSAWAQAEPELAWIVGAAALEDALRAAVRFAPRVTRVTAPVPAALTVLAEGKDSASRAALGARMVRHPYGQRVAHGGGDLGARRVDVGDRAAHAGLDEPQRDRASELLALPPAAFEAALADATGGAAGRLTLAGPRAAWPLSIGRAEPLHGPGWVLVGDAAHVVHPLAGQGLNLGLADVASLAAVLAAREGWRPLGDERLLARHARAREGPVRAMGLVTDGLLHLFSSRAPLARELRNRGLGLVNRLPPVKQLLAQRAIGGAR